MILRNRLYERKEPDRDATLCIMYCEGSKRELQYFNYFKGISSRILLEVVQADSQGNNSPTGLYEQACKDVGDYGADTLAKYEMGEGDQLWFVIDTDQWDSHISQLKRSCERRQRWYVAQSNPCFEVWLYYHFFSEDATSLALADCSAWKSYVNNRVVGGFDSRKHPIYIIEAITNAKKWFSAPNGVVAYGSTEMFKLGEIIYSMAASEVLKARRMLRL